MSLTTKEALIKESAYRQVAKHLHALQKRVGLHEPQTQKELYTTDEVAQMLGVSERFVKQLIEAGQIKSVLIKANPRASRGTRRVSRAQMEAYIKKLEVEAKFSK